MTIKTLTRNDLTEALIREIGFSRTESVDLLGQVLEEIAEAVLDGDEVKISLFGTFSLLDKRQRIGRNPKTGEEVPITPRRVMTFHSSNHLKNAVNEGCQKLLP